MGSVAHSMCWRGRGDCSGMTSVLVNDLDRTVDRDQGEAE
jgi:hypothetical protein